MLHAWVLPSDALDQHSTVMHDLGKDGAKVMATVNMGCLCRQMPHRMMQPRDVQHNTAQHRAQHGTMQASMRDCLHELDEGVSARPGSPLASGMSGRACW